MDAGSSRSCRPGGICVHRVVGAFTRIMPEYDDDTGQLDPSRNHSPSLQQASHLTRMHRLLASRATLWGCDGSAGGVKADWT